MKYHEESVQNMDWIKRTANSRDEEGLSNSTGVISEYTCKAVDILPRLMSWAISEFGSRRVAFWMVEVMTDLGDLWLNGVTGSEVVSLQLEWLEEKIQCEQAPDVHLGMHPDDGACYGVWPMSLYDDDA